MDDQDDESEQAAEGKGFQVELLREYLEFGKRALKARWLLTSIVLLVGTSLAVLTAVYWPRTYLCTTVLMPVGNPVLDSRILAAPLAGAEDLILRHENLAAIVHETDLVRKKAERRPPLLKLKDRIMRTLVGEASKKDELAILVATLEAKLEVTAEKGDLTIVASWSDGQTAADLARAARESFVKARHVAEMSAFEEKMAILNEHATKLVGDISAYAEQVRASRTERMKQVRGEATAREKDLDSASPSLLSGRTVVSRAAPEADPALPALKDKLALLKKSLADVEAARDTRLHEAQAKFEDMKLHLTPAHPDVVTQGERVAMLAQVPSEMALLQAEVSDVQGEIRQREGLARTGGSMTYGTTQISASRPVGAELPPDIALLLRDETGDPALTAQLSSALTTYASLRSDLLATRIDLDTAQAAFNHRYQVIIPAEVPPKPSKPKPALILAIGFIATLLLGLALPILFAVREGVLADRWQVERQLPVLAELHLPPQSGE